MLQLTYLREQFTLLGPSKNGYVSMQNYKTRPPARSYGNVGRTWEQHARRAYELFEKYGNRPIMIDELALELGLGPSVSVHVVIKNWIRHSDGKLSFLGFVRLLHGVSSWTLQKA